MKFFNKKTSFKLALEISDDWLKWVLADVSGSKHKVLEIGIFSLSRQKAAASQKLASLVKKYKIDSQSIVSLIPRRQVTTRNLEVPSTNNSEIKKIVSLQAVKQTPYAPEEIVYDFYPLPSTRSGYSRAMLIVAHREIINTHLVELESLGVKSDEITISTQSSARWLSKTLSNLLGKQTYAVLDLDNSNADFFIGEGEEIFFSQSVSLVSEKFVMDLVRAYQIYRSEDFAKEPKLLVISGVYEPLKPLLERFATEVGLILKFANSPKELEGFRAENENLGKHSLTALLGLATDPKQSLINLVPQELILRDSVIQKGKTLLITGVLFLSIFLIVISMFVFHFYEKKNYLKWLEQKVSEVDAQATEVNSLKKSIRYVEQLQVANKRFFDALVYVHNKISNETYLTEINYTKERRFQIQGRSDSIASVFDFVEKLKTNPSFNDLETKRMTKRIVDNKEVVDFEIDSVLVPPSTRPAQGAKK